MKRFILVTFLFLGFGFYELSGGSDFDPEDNRLAMIEARQERAEAPTLVAMVTPKPVAASIGSGPEADTEVTRAALNLVSFDAVNSGGEKAEPIVAPAESPAPAALREEPALAIEELAANTQLSIAALDTGSQANTVAFAGNTIAAASQDAAQTVDIRRVKGTLVNMRSGPGTDYDVVDQLSQSTEVEILTDSGNGWVELRPVAGGATGWIAEFLLTGG